METIKARPLLLAFLKSMIKNDYYHLFKIFEPYDVGVKIHNESHNSVYWINSTDIFNESMKRNDAIVKGLNFGIVRNRMPSLAYAAIASKHREIMSRIYAQYINAREVIKFKDVLLGIIDSELSSLNNCHGKVIDFGQKLERIMMRFHNYVLFGVDDMAEYSWYITGVITMATHCMFESVYSKLLPTIIRKPIVRRRLAQNEKFRKEYEERTNAFIDRARRMQKDCFCNALLNNPELEHTDGYDIEWELFLALGFGAAVTVSELKYAFDFVGSYPQEVEKIVKAEGVDREHKVLHFMQETFRLRAPYFPIVRDCCSDVELCGEKFQAGDRLLYAPIMLHRKNKFYKEPLDFNPGRYDNMQTGDFLKNFLSFGAGSHACAGRDYATKICCIILDECLKRFSFQGKKKPSLTLTVPAFLLVPSNKLMLRVDKI